MAFLWMSRRNPLGCILTCVSIEEFGILSWNVGSAIQNQEDTNGPPIQRERNVERKSRSVSAVCPRATTTSGPRSPHQYQWRKKWRLSLELRLMNAHEGRRDRRDGHYTHRYGSEL